MDTQQPASVRMGPGGTANDSVPPVAASVERMRLFDQMPPKDRHEVNYAINPGAAWRNAIQRLIYAGRI